MVDEEAARSGSESRPEAGDSADDLPSTRRLISGEAVAAADARKAWGRAAVPILREVAGTYNATITYMELSERVQEATGIVTGQLMRYWIGKVLYIVAEECSASGEPILSSLCVRADGTVGEGYGEAIQRARDIAPEDLELHAAQERLACYRLHATDLPSDGGQPTLTPSEAKRRARPTRPTTKAVPRATCPTCHMQLPLTGRCDTCE